MFNRLSKTQQIANDKTDCKWHNRLQMTKQIANDKTKAAIS